MPGKASGPPPLNFLGACERWAQGVATSYDTAVLTALTTRTPLPEPYDAAAVGFLTTTRLPPTSTEHLFHAAKNDARLQFHNTSTEATRMATITSLTDNFPLDNVSFPLSLAAAPARLGLRDAAAAALGAPRTVIWTVPLPVIVAAGPSFCRAARAAGWNPLSDLEGDPSCIIWTSQTDITDTSLARLVVSLTRIGPTADIIPAGSFKFGDFRASRSRAPFLIGIFLRVRVSLGTRRRFNSRYLSPARRNANHTVLS